MYVCMYVHMYVFDACFADLLNRIFKVAPAERITLADAQAHPFITSAVQPSSDVILAHLKEIDFAAISAQLQARELARIERQK